jgi:AraC-like DNA-binding protein
MVSTSIGSLFYFGERILLGCKGLTAEAHSHYAVSLLLTLSNPFQVINKKGKIIVCEGILIPPNYHHTLIANQSEMIVLQFDPKSYDYTTLKASYSNTEPVLFKTEFYADLLPQLNLLMIGDLECESALRLYYKILNCFGKMGTRQIIPDARMKSALKIIEETLPDSIRVGQIADEIGISEDRFMHWFKEQFGIPLRQYLLWRRLHIAARLLQTGTSLTDASHAAGFSDQSHLSKTFRKMFGVPPSRFLGGNENFKVCFCTEGLG